MTATWVPRMPAVAGASALPAQPAVDRIKVLHVITNFTAGAAGNTFLSAVGMDPSRYEVWVVSSPGGEFWERSAAAGVRCVQLPEFVREISPGKDLVTLVALVRLIRRERFSIVHTHTTKAGFLGRAAARLCGTPVVVHTFHAFSFHDFMRPATRRAYIALERLLRPLTDEFVAVSPLVAREAVEHRLAPPAGVSVIPSAVEAFEDSAAPARPFRAELGVSASAPLIGTVGRLVFQKAPLDFVRMAARVASQRPDARFVMVGDGPLSDDAKLEAARLGVDVTFTGFRPDAAALAAEFTVFVMPSLYEGLGRALTEALVSGRPVVASAVNGIPDLVRPGETGLLAPPADPAAVADCVLWLLDHPEAAERMGRQGRTSVLALFRPERMCAALDEAYCRLLGLPAPTGGLDLAPVLTLSAAADRAPATVTATP